VFLVVLVVFVKMPHVFTHVENEDVIFVYGFVIEMLLLRVEKNLRLPNCRVPDSRVFASVYNKLLETGRLPSSHISFERVNEQNVDEVVSFLQSV